MKMSIAGSINSKSNVESDKPSFNGLILNDVYLPVELIQHILCYADTETLLNCQQVCKNWNKTIHDYVWRKKAEVRMGCTFSSDVFIDWKVFYFIYTKNLFDKNLVRNHSGEKGFKYWNVFHNDIYYGGWDRFGGNHSADNDIFGGIDNYGNHNNDDCDEDSDSEDGTYNDDNNVEDDDIDIIFEEETRSVGENSIETASESTNESEDEESGSENGSKNGNEIVDENENDSESSDDEESESSDDEVSYGNSCRGWIVECPPIGAPQLPEEPQFESRQNCFVTTYCECRKEYMIDLIKEGFKGDILDQLQPPIEISEWYCSRWDSVAVYKLRVCLMNKSGRQIGEFSFNDNLQGEKQNVWHNVKHEFTNYGSGLRKIFFMHGGHEQQFINQSRGSKMAGACVKIKLKIGNKTKCCK